MQVIEQNSRHFKGWISYPLTDGTVITKEFAGVLSPGGKTFKTVQYLGSKGEYTPYGNSTAIGATARGIRSWVKKYWMTCITPAAKENSPAGMIMAMAKAMTKMPSPFRGDVIRTL